MHTLLSPSETIVAVVPHNPGYYFIFGNMGTVIEAEWNSYRNSFFYRRVSGVVQG